MKYINLLTRQHVASLVIAILASAPLLAGGPWTQAKGEGFGQVSYSFIPEYRSLYVSGGGSDDALGLNRNVTDMTIVGYIEHGLSDRLTISGIIPYKITETSEETFTSDFPNVLAAGSLSGLGNITAGLKYNFISSSLLVSGVVLVDAKTSKSDSLTGLRTGYGAWGVAPVVSIGGSRNNFYGFVDTGLRFRTNDYSNEFILNGEAGIQLFNRLWVIGVLDVRQSITDGTADNENSEQTGLYPDNQEYVAPGFKLLYDITPKFGLNFSAFGAISGNLVAKSPSNTLGIYMKW